MLIVVRGYSLHSSRHTVKVHIPVLSMTKGHTVAHILKFMNTLFGGGWGCCLSLCCVPLPICPSFITPPSPLPPLLFMPSPNWPPHTLLFCPRFKISGTIPCVTCCESQGKDCWEREELKRERKRPCDCSDKLKDRPQRLQAAEEKHRIPKLKYIKVPSFHGKH